MNEIGSSHVLEQVDPNDTRLLACHFKRIFALMLTLVSLVFIFIAADGLLFNVVLSSKGAVVNTVLVILLLIALLVLYAGVNQLFHPHLMLEITNRGIYKRFVKADYKPAIFFVPWEWVTDMSYIKTTATGSGGKTVLVRVIAVKLDLDDHFEIPKGVCDFIPGDDDGSTLYIDTINPQPGGERLLELMRGYHSNQQQD